MPARSETQVPPLRDIVMITKPQSFTRMLVLALLGSVLMLASCSEPEPRLPPAPPAVPPPAPPPEPPAPPEPPDPPEPPEPDPEDEPYELGLSPADGLTPVAVSISVELPASTGIDAADLRLLSVLQRTVPLGANGSASFTVFQDGPMLVAAVLPTGEPVLLGWVDASQGSQKLSARSTAEVLAWFDIGAHLLLDPARPAMVKALRTAPELASLEQAVAQGLRSAPHHLEGIGPSLRPARVQAAQAILAGAEAARRQAPQRGIVVDPGDLQSGSRVLQQALERIAVENTFRIRRMAYVDRISPSSAEVAKIDLSPTTGVNSVTSAISNIATAAIFNYNETAYAGITSEPIRVQMNPADGTRTDYRVTVIGAGARPGSAAQLPSHRLADLDRLIRETLIIDFVLPLLSNVGGPILPDGTKYFNDKVDPGVLGAVVEQLINRTPDVVEKASSGDFLGAVGLLIAGLVEDNSKDLLLLIAEGYVKERMLENGATEAAIEAAAKQFKDGAKKILGAIALADPVIQGIDLAIQLLDLKASARAETFSVIVTPTKVNLTPASRSIRRDEELEFTALIPEATGGDDAFEYRWKTTGNHGVLKDAVGHEGTEFASSRDRVTYVPNGDSEGDDQVIVEVYLIDNAERIRLGTDTSTVRVIEIEVTLTPSVAKLGPGQKVQFNAEVTPRPAGEIYYRWTTSGNHGTTFPASGALGFSWLEYTVRNNAAKGGTDWVEVEVFMDLTEQNPTGPPLAKARATVEIDEIQSRVEVRSGTSPAVWCVQSVLVFPAVQGARSYEIRISNHNHGAQPPLRVMTVPAPTRPYVACGLNGSDLANTEGNSVVVWLAWSTGDHRADQSPARAWHAQAYTSARVEVLPRF